ncbi:MAG TPA: glycosyltransferase family 2 protein [Xanthobacteraceae bacterium]|nr:glycosyltransferase family 2 protein [Xanthobacteraceae bacterium]
MAAFAERSIDAGARPEDRRSGGKSQSAAATYEKSLPPELSVVVPTFNEAENIPVLVESLANALAGVAWEVIFVDDDSPDGTWRVAKGIGEGDARVRCVRRIGRRGLSGACLEGVLASQAPLVCIMDADLQHDEALLPSMLEILRRGESDLVVATRYGHGGSADNLSSDRALKSRIATALAGWLLKRRLSDPMSGFFMVRREIVERVAPRLSTQGFKILFDIVMTAGDALRVRELPYRFGARRHGESKFDGRAALEFLGLLLAKLTADTVPLRFIFFCVVGAIGIGVHLAALTAGLDLLQLNFAWAQTMATAVAIASNFALNNAFTYRDQRRTGWRFVTGLMSFYVVSAVGAMSNVGVGNWIFSTQHVWWVAGLGGAIMGVVWNYVVASQFIWRQR